MNFQFDDEEAVAYGVPEAVMINNLRFWIIKNKANNKHFYEGRTWTYNGLEAFARLFPFWTPKQIRRIINSLLEQQIIIKGNFNGTAYDRTCWYAFSDESIFLNRHLQMPERANGKAQKGTPIPDSNTDTYTDNKNSTYGAPGLEAELFPIENKEKESPPGCAAPPKKTSRKLSPKVYFKDCLFMDLNYTKEFFQGTDLAQCDLDYYHSKIVEWATIKNGKTKRRDELGWRDTFYNWIFKDNEAGTLRTLNNKIGHHAINKPSSNGKQTGGQSFDDIKAKYRKSN